MNRKPVLSFYTNMPTPYQLDFFEALKEHFDLRVVYFTVRESDRQWNLSTSGDGYSVQVLKNSRLALWVQKKITSFHFSRDIISLLRKDDSQYVLVNGTYWSPNVMLALYISYKRKKKVAFWSEPVFPVNNRFRFLLKKIMLRPVMRYTNLLLAIGKQAELAFRQYGYVKSIHNIPYNININLFNKKNLRPEIFQDLVRQYKLNKEIILLSSGSLIKRKGMDTLVKAFLQLPPELKARLVIIGDGEEKDELLKMSNSNQRIHFIGFQEKNMVPYWYNLADIFVFASRYDGWGLVINEAAAADNAIICSKATGAAIDKLIDGRNAMLLDPDDVDGFARAMQTLITDEQVRIQIRSQNEILKKELSSEYNAQKLYNIFRNAE